MNWWDNIKHKYVGGETRTDRVLGWLKNSEYSFLIVVLIAVVAGVLTIMLIK